ncbi:hypothetical protein EGW08_008585 [Elysia chlorotica]|uniref:Uncharacterized protein n=1 Tax=Elysia chlorotica TaxID=188477 RepID=A0A3S1C5N0_ELYCH|nr:hypothetical protein EGW08_008585 [Elysia chlorotica]
MAATTGAGPRFQLSRHNTTLSHQGNAMGPAVTMPRSAAAPGTTGPLDARPSQAGAGEGPARSETDPNTGTKDKSTSSFKRNLAAARNSRNDETIRRKMAQLKEQQRQLAGGRYPSGAKTPIQRDMEAAAQSRVESELGRPVSSSDWPFVYFVVSVDQQPQQAGDGNGGDGTARGMHTARQRQRFLVSRRRKVQEAREETERIREANIDMGLRLEPIKPKAQVLDHQQHLQRMRTRPSLSKHPTTPVSSVGSRHEFNFLNTNDDLSDLETRRSIGLIISDTLNEVGFGPRGGGAGGVSTDRAGLTNKHCPVSTLELPEISAGTKRRALGTSPGRQREDPGDRKMVTFADSLPGIKGNGIPVIGVKPVDANTPQSATLANKPEASPRAGELSTEGAPGTGSIGGGFLQPPWSAPLTLRSINSFTPKSRMYTPMALPKIDIVSEIYDELIVKTIQNYLMAEGYSQEKFHQLRQTVLSRLSATYPHLVKHKAWRQEGMAGDTPAPQTRDSSAVPGPTTGMTSAPGEPQVRSKVMRNGPMGSRPGRSSGVLGLTSDDGSYSASHNVRPASLCPFFYPTTLGQQLPYDFWLVGGSGGYKASSFPISPSPFMSIDGRTMTITPRLSPQFSPGAGPVQTPGAAVPRSQAQTEGGRDFQISGWTPSPGAANEKLPSMAEEEPMLTHCPSMSAQLPSGEGRTDTDGQTNSNAEKAKQAEHVNTEKGSHVAEASIPPAVEGGEHDHANGENDRNNADSEGKPTERNNENKDTGNDDESTAKKNEPEDQEGKTLTGDKDKEEKGVVLEQ